MLAMTRSATAAWQAFDEALAKLEAEGAAEQGDADARAEPRLDELAGRLVSLLIEVQAADELGLLGEMEGVDGLSAPHGLAAVMARAHEHLSPTDGGDAE